MGISAVRSAPYTPVQAPKTQRMDTQHALESRQARQVSQPTRMASSQVSAVSPRHDASPPRDKGSRVDVRV